MISQLTQTKYAPGKNPNSHIMTEERRKKISESHKGKTPKNFKEIQQKAWESTRGKEPWNKGTKGICKPNKTSFKRRGLTFKGTHSEYTALHKWVRRHLGNPLSCVKCLGNGVVNVTRIEWANISGEYRKEYDDWMPLCKKHHYYFDKKYE